MFGRIWLDKSSTGFMKYVMEAWNSIELDMAPELYVQLSRFTPAPPPAHDHSKVFKR
jgi:hypothetical protein